MKTTTKGRQGEKLTATSLRSITSQIKTLSERVDSLSEKVVVVRDADGRFLRASIPVGAKTEAAANRVGDTVIGDTSVFYEALVCAGVDFASLEGNGIVKRFEVVERPTGYACDPDSPEFNNVLMKCFADGKRKALKEAKQHASKSKRK